MVAELENDDPDTFRMMISTDNHLGFAEKDPVRGEDSFAAFEEMLYLARKFHCDTVLLGGDLFHENRPSRRCLHRTMEILRKYAMGPDPVRVQSLGGLFNFQDPNYAVHLPIFSIHGNHDDPSSDQGAKDLLAALDLLSVTNLVNYFGRQDDLDQVEVSPLLLQKGTTKIALYGLGSIREERLNRLWTKDKVRFLKTEEEEGFFNMFVLHQNRDVGRGSKNCVQESMIPSWMDVVLWGHEHECLIDWVESVVGTFRISQPGSSVATSLCAGEAARKKVGILDIRGQQFRLNAIPLTQVRPFVTTEVVLKTCRANLDPEDPNVEKKISQFLVEQTQVMVLNAREEYAELLEDAKKNGNDAYSDDCPTQFKLTNPKEVLVRIRVEHSGFATINNQRFGSNFVGDIANTQDILLFHRAKNAKLSKVKTKGVGPVEPEDLERTDMVDLVKEFLSAPDEKLKFLGEKTLSEAMEEFVDKGRTSAITEYADEQHAKKRAFLISKKDSTNNGDIDESLDLSQVDNSAMDESSLMEDESIKPKKRKAPRKPSPKAATSFGDSSDDEPQVVEKPKPKPRAKRTTAKRKVAYSVEKDDDSSDADDFSSTRKAKPAAKSRANSQRSAAKRSRRRFESDDEEEEDEHSEIAANWGTAATQSQF